MSREVRAGIKKTFPAAALILALFISASTGIHFIGLAEANPYLYGGGRSPPSDASPLVISILSPKNSTFYRVNNITLTFNVSTPESTGVEYLMYVYYKADWLKNDVYVYKQDVLNPQFPTFTKWNITYLIPDGEHSVVINASGGGSYVEGIEWYSFDMTSISVINFTIDATSPKVSILSFENKTYGTSDLPLNFTMNESISQISYVLDGQENVTISGNTTLTGLPDGSHSVTVYAKDVAGNTGASETVYFSVKIPFPTALVATASAATAAIIGAGLLAYFKKRNH